MIANSLTDTLNIDTKTDREIRITRQFRAPAEIVWDCYTQPALLKRWLTGPPGWGLTTCEVDLRVGGKYLYGWSMAGGPEMRMHGVHRIITPHTRIVVTQAYDGMPPEAEMLGTLAFSEVDGLTTLTNTILYPSNEAREAAIRMGAMSNMKPGYEALEELVAEYV